jgi:chemotaxis receptor (MCP) glutamine deamidase CheD
VSNDLPDHEDRDHGRVKHKSGEGTVGTGTIGSCIAVAAADGVGTVGAAISVLCAASEITAKVVGSHYASAVCRPREGVL